MSLLSYECVFIHFLAYHRRGMGGCQGKKMLFLREGFFWQVQANVGRWREWQAINAFLLGGFEVKCHTQFWGPFPMSPMG
ncbi:MAG: hypothetical protein NT087_08870 [Deltaproteobacteria bacterium]|nr:hypothetical protein [Deltaproteobacteria bacterium]